MRKLLSSVLVLLSASVALAAETGPYQPDEHTLFLAHFDSSAIADYARGTPVPEGSPSSPRYILEKGRFGAALRVLEGCSACYRGDDGNIDLAEGSIEFWLKPDWGGDDGRTRTFMSINAGKLNHLNLNKLGKGNFGRLGGGICGPDKSKKRGIAFYRFKYDCSGWRPGEWHHYALSWGRGELHFYIDGNEVDSSREVAPPSGSAPWIGLYDFRGLLDELRISDVQRKPFDRAPAIAARPPGVRMEPQPSPAPIWSLLVDDIDADGTDELVLGGVDHWLYVQKDGATAWKYDLKGIPYDLACGDVTGDGRQEIGACSFDDEGRFYLLGSDGALLGRYGVGLPFMGVAMSDLDGDGEAEIVLAGGDCNLHVLDAALALKWKKAIGRRVVAVEAGDLDGDGKAEIVVGTHWNGIICLDHTGARQWGSRACGGAIGNLLLADLDGDGRKEAIAGEVHGPTAIGVLDHRGKMLWHKEGRGGFGSGCCPAAVADLARSSGNEILTFDQVHGTLQILSSEGRFLKALQNVKPPLRLASRPGRSEVWASSLGTRDRHVYKLAVDESGVDDLTKMTQSTPVQRDAEALYEWAKRQSLRKPTFQRPPTRKFHVLVNFGSSPKQIVRFYREFLDPLNSDYLEFQVFVNVGTKPKQSQLLAIARTCERERVPVRFWIAHGCVPWVDTRTAKELLKAAPTYCRGFNVGESFVSRGFDSPKWQKFVTYLEQLLTMCRDRNATVIVEEMLDGWVSIPVGGAAASKLLRPQYRSTLIPMIRSNNAHCTEIQTGAILGLWQGGLIQDWGISSQNWNWAWDQQSSMTQLCPDDVVLRMDLAAASLGATYFHVEGYSQHFYEYVGSGVRIHPRAKRHRALLYELMRKGMVLPVASDQLANLSPVAFRVKRSPSRDYTHDWYRHGGSAPKGLFDFRFCMQSTSSDYASTYLYGLRHYFDGLFPATPYGFVRAFPESLDLSRLKGVGACITTDGSMVYEGQEALSAAQARRSVERQFREASRELPFRVEDVFLSAQRWGDEYLLYLLDSEYLTPAGVDAQVTVNLPVDRFSVEDWLTRESIEAKGQGFTVRVPPASFRILRVRLH